MPDDLFKIPSFLSATTLAIIFASALIIFHWLLVFVWPLNKFGWKPLGKYGWKIVDYVWLLSGSIALVATVFQARQVLATSMLPALESIVSSSVDGAEYYSSPKFYDGLLCRKFERSQFSPPEEEFKRTQKEYNDACAWANQISEHIKGVDRWGIIDIPSLPKPLEATDPSIPKLEQEMFDAFKTHNAIALKRKALQEASKRSESEQFFVIVAPVLAVFALALRITKVTGEIRLG
jgi:hypothetical protein